MIPVPSRRTARNPLRGNDSHWSQLRLARGLSLDQLSRLSGVPRSVVGLICQGRLNPRPDEAAALLGILEPGEKVASTENTLPPK